MGENDADIFTVINLINIIIPGREADHTPPCSTDIKNAWSIPPFPYTSSWRGA
jgi:hypothetical protein